MGAGIGVFISVKGSQALATMRRLSRAFNVFDKSVKRARRGMTMMTGAITKLAIGGAAFSLIMGAGVSVAANFESAMAGVAAVSDRTGKDWDKTFQNMSARAQELGATTAFTATQAAEGMEVLTRAGFSSAETMEAIAPVLNAAAAEGMGLAEAASTVANVLRGMKIPIIDVATGMNNAARVADVLALASARTKTSMADLGQAFSLGATMASDLGFTLEETTAVFGLLSNIGIESTRSGTALRAALSKLIKPSKEAQKFMKKYGISLKDTSGEMKTGKQLFLDIVSGLGEVTDKADLARIGFELFGLRGVGVASALRAAGETDIKVLIDQLENATGAAKEMARIRLDTFKGQLTILRSAVEGLALSFFSGFLEPMKGGLTAASTFIGNVAFAVGLLGSGFKDASDSSIKRFSKLSETVKDVASGLVDAKNSILSFGSSVVKAFRRVKTFVESTFGGEGIRQITKWGAIFATVLGVVIPVLVVVALAASLLSGVFGLVAGAALFLSGILFPLSVAVAVVAAIFLAFRKEGESVVDTFKRFAGGAVVAFGKFKSGFMAAMGPAIAIIKTQLGPIIENLKSSIQNAFAAMGVALGDSEITWESFGAAVGVVIGAIAIVITALIGTVSELVVTITKALSQMQKLKEGIAFEIAQEGLGSTLADFSRFVVGAKSSLERVPRAPAPKAPPITGAAPRQGAPAGQQINIEIPPPLPTSVRVPVVTSTTTILQIDGAEVAKKIKKHTKETESRGGETP